MLFSVSLIWGGTFLYNFLVEKITFFMTIVIYMLQKIGSLSYL